MGDAEKTSELARREETEELLDVLTGEGALRKGGGGAKGHGEEVG